MALVLMTKTRQRLAIGQSNPTLRPFQGLNSGFFIDGQDERILGRIQIKTNNVGGLAGKLRVSRNAPTVAPFQFDALLAQNVPDLIGGNIAQMLGNQPPIPASIAVGGFLSRSSNTRWTVTSSYLAGLPLRGASSNPAIP